MFKKRGKQRNRRIQNRKRKGYKFSDKVHPIKGILSFAFAVISIIIFIITSYIAYKSKGNAGILVGLAGVIALLLTISGVILSIVALREKEIHYQFPICGGILCAFLLIGYMIMYTLGAII
ncbi:MAG: DUF6142 family protein [Velocimicrobium sp.]